VANRGLDNIAVINSQTDQLLSNNTITNIPDPRVMAFDPINSKMYVETSSNGVAVIDTDNDEIISTIPISSVRYLIYEPTHRILYVAHATEISAINTANDQIIDTIDIERSIEYIEYNDNEEKIYTVNRNDDSVSVLDAFLNTKILQVKDGNGNIITSGNTINTNSLNITVKTQNQFDVDGVICYLNGTLYEGCEQFDDPPGDDPDTDLKNCTIQQGDVEVCIFTIPINNLANGSYAFTVATFDEASEAELSTINQEMESSQFFPLSKNQIQNEQSNTELSLMDSNSSSNLRLDKNGLSSK
jgi:6-phosphogluconolactonase (cycloisomerase 2 family)